MGASGRTWTASPAGVVHAIKCQSWIAVKWAAVVNSCCQVLQLRTVEHENTPGYDDITYQQFFCSVFRLRTFLLWMIFHLVCYTHVYWSIILLLRTRTWALKIILKHSEQNYTCKCSRAFSRHKRNVTPYCFKILTCYHLLTINSTSDHLNRWVISEYSVKYHESQVLFLGRGPYHDESYYTKQFCVFCFTWSWHSDNIINILCLWWLMFPFKSTYPNYDFQYRLRTFSTLIPDNFIETGTRSSWTWKSVNLIKILQFLSYKSVPNLSASPEKIFGIWMITWEYKIKSE